MKDLNGKILEEGDKVVWAPGGGVIQGTIKKLSSLIEAGGPPQGILRMEVEVTFKFAFPSNIDINPCGMWLTEKAVEAKSLLTSSTQ